LLFHYKDARVHCAVLKKRAGPELPSQKKWEKLAAERSVAKQPTLQDPTACLWFVATSRSTPKWLYLLSQGWVRGVASKNVLTGQCSTRCLPINQGHLPWSQRWTG